MVGSQTFRVHPDSSTPDYPHQYQVQAGYVKKEPTGKWFATFGIEMDREPLDYPVHSQ